ncbi:MAG: hypothetical protein ACAI35_12500 [Candidatus Methylacidiphilales bacterium]|nr:hypothetical protein [Candidatus Methylacidiphilales bacterium]
MRYRSCILGLLLLLSSTFAGAVPPELREPDVFYFDENLAEPLKVELIKPIDIFGGRDLTTRLSTAPTGAIVQIVGKTRDLYLVSVRTTNRKTEGWISINTLPPIPPEVLAEAKANQEKRDNIQRAIKAKKVILGMTFEDVKKALGRPERTSFREDNNGRTDTWKYITYESQPETRYVTGPYGQIIAQTYYVKVPVGELAIDFSKGAVSSVEEHRQTDSAPSRGVNVPQ